MSIKRDKLDKICRMAEKYISCLEDFSSIFYFKDNKLIVRTGAFYFEHPLELDIAFVVRGSDFCKAVKSFPGDMVDIALSKNGNSLKVFDKSTKMVLKIPVVKDKSSIPMPETWTTVNNDFFKNLQSVARFSRSELGDNMALSFILLQGCRAYATDSMSAGYVDLADDVDFKTTLLPPKVVSNIKLKDYGDLVGIHVNENSIWFKFSTGCIVASSLGYGDLSTLPEFIPSDYSSCAHVYFEGGCFVSALKMCREAEYNLTLDDKAVIVECSGSHCVVSCEGVWSVRQEMEMKSPVEQDIKFKISSEKLIKFVGDEFHFNPEKGYVAFPIDGGLGLTMTRR